MKAPTIISLGSSLTGIGFTLSDMESAVRLAGGIVFVLTAIVSFIYMVRNQRRKEHNERDERNERRRHRGKE